MRPPVDAARIRELAHRLGRVAPERTRIYLTGGATAVLEGWRTSTIDIDVRIEPESEALLRELVGLKDRLGINVEFASPPDFIPELPGWRERSPLVCGTATSICITSTRTRRRCRRSSAASRTISPTFKACWRPA